MVLQAEVLIAGVAGTSGIQVKGSLQTRTGKDRQVIEKAIGSTTGAFPLAPAGPVLLHTLGNDLTLFLIHGFTAAARGQRKSTGTFELFQRLDDLVELLQFLVQLPNCFIEVHCAGSHRSLRPQLVCTPRSA